MSYDRLERVAKKYGVDVTDMMRLAGVASVAELYEKTLKGSDIMTKSEYASWLAKEARAVKDQVDAAENEGMVYH